MKSTRKRLKENPVTPWILLALALFPANVYMLYHMNTSGVLAEVAGQRLYRRDLSTEADAEIRMFENARYGAFERRIEEWATKVVLESEAKRMGKTVEQLLATKTEAIRVSDADVWDRYRRTPTADTRSFPASLDEIRNVLQREQETLVRRAYSHELLHREGFRIHAAKPEGYQSVSAPTFFPVYTPPPVEDLKNGRVVSPPSRGPISAPVVMEIYSDFMCPYSRRFSGTMRALEQKYPDSLRVVFRHFPLTFHVGADKLAEASLCAQEQGEFWPMHDVLMQWEGAVDAVKLTEAAQKFGADPGAFSACLADGRYRNFVKREISGAATRQIQSSPTVFLNGRKIVGALPVEKMTPLVDWFLSDEKTEYPGKAYNPAPPAPGAANNKRPSAPPADMTPVVFANEFLSSGPAKGPKDAAVTVVEFIDFNCPFCQRGAQAIDPAVDGAKPPVRFLSKQLPLPMHPNAEKTAVAALCADREGKYFEYRSQIFGAFWGKQTADDLKAAATAAGVNRSKFDKCLDGSETLDQVRKDAATAASVSATGTPTYFVNGKRVVGANGPQVQALIAEASTKK